MFRVWGLEFRVWGLGLAGFQDLGLTVERPTLLGFRSLSALEVVSVTAREAKSTSLRSDDRTTGLQGQRPTLEPLNPKPKPKP